MKKRRIMKYNMNNKFRSYVTIPKEWARELGYTRQTELELVYDTETKEITVKECK